MFRLVLTARRSGARREERGIPVQIEETAGVRLYRDDHTALAEPRISDTVVALAVPNAFECSTLLATPLDANGGASAESAGSIDLEHSPVLVTVITNLGGDGARASAPMVAFKFATATEAGRFYEHHHGRWLQPSSGNAAPNALLLKLVFVDQITDEGCRGDDDPEDALAGTPPDATLTAPRPPAATLGVELPCCPVCLDRLDPSVSCVGPGACSHKSMMAALSAGGESAPCQCWAAVPRGSCRVCTTLELAARSSSQALAAREAARSSDGGPAEAGRTESAAAATETTAATAATALAVASVEAAPFADGNAVPTAAAAAVIVECGVCKVRDRLWTCLVCGFVGCGRYTAEHSLQHFQASDNRGHRWALELGSRRIWDYWEDSYAHRLPGSLPGSLPGGFAGGLGTAGGGHGLAGSGARGGGSSGSSGSGSSGSGSSGSGGSGGVIGGSGDALVAKGGEAAAALYRGQWGGVGAGDFGGGDEAVVKLGGLVAEYESLLVAQLSEQRRYFERLLAKEAAAQIEAQAEAEAEASCGSGSGGGDVGGAVRAEVESLRTAVAALEAEYRALEQAVAGEEASLRAARRDQRALLEAQAAAERAANRARDEAAALKAQVAAEVSELEAVAGELALHHRTAQRVGKSPLKAEIMAGSVLVTEAERGGRGGGGARRANHGGNRRVP